MKTNPTNYNEWIAYIHFEASKRRSAVKRTSDKITSKHKAKGDLITKIN